MTDLFRETFGNERTYSVKCVLSELICNNENFVKGKVCIYGGIGVCWRSLSDTKHTVTIYDISCALRLWTLITTFASTVHFAFPYLEKDADFRNCSCKHFPDR